MKKNLTFINPEGKEELIEVYITKERFPIVYEKKMKELTETCGMTKEEAERHIAKCPILLELYYSSDNGLYAVESEALCNTEVYDPYTGLEMPEMEDNWVYDGE